MIAQLVRAASLSAGASEEYSDGIVKGNEPPVEGDGLVIRLCGRDSFTSEVSMQRMGFHFFPVGTWVHQKGIWSFLWYQRRRLYSPLLPSYFIFSSLFGFQQFDVLL